MKILADPGLVTRVKRGLRVWCAVPSRLDPLRAVPRLSSNHVTRRSWVATPRDDDDDSGLGHGPCPGSCGLAATIAMGDGGGRRSAGCGGRAHRQAASSVASMA